jgi:hypothetical protein
VKRTVRVSWVCSALLLGLLGLAEPASAQELFERVSPDIEVFGITNLESKGTEAFEPGLGGAIHIGVNIVRGLAIHGGGQLFVLTPGTLNETYYIGSQLGVRWHWTRLFDLWGDSYVDAHWIWGLSEGQISAHGFDVGLGYDFPVAPIIGLGPFVRFSWMKDPGVSNPMFLTFGVSMSLMTFTRSGETIPDEDLDGVPDHEDICPAIPIGRHPDPENQGCPARDRDDDGLVDPLDACPSESMWPHPSTTHHGCPMPDADGDGVPDDHDVCPNTFAPDGGDPLREGCIEGEDPY